MSFVPVELIALVLLIALGVYALRAEKKLGKTENKLEVAEAQLKAHEVTDAKIKKIDIELANTDRAERLSKRKYRD